VRATDAAGNTDASPATQSWTIDPGADTTPPGTAITTGPPDYTSASTATFAFTSRDPDPVFECSLDSGPWEPCASPTTYIDLAVGLHTFSVRATDEAGNTDPTPATETWRILYHRWWWPRSIS
jgi:large repetitive protein